MPELIYTQANKKHNICRAHLRVCDSCQSNLFSKTLENSLSDIGWTIVGGESGPGARPMREEWVISIRDLCTVARVPFFFKQWGGVRKKRNGRLLHGRSYDEYPARVAKPVPEGERCSLYAASIRESLRELVSPSLVQLSA